MKRSDFVLGFFAVLVIFSLVAKGVHTVMSGEEPNCLKISGK